MLVGGDTHTVTRVTGAYINGVWTEDASTTFDIFGTIAPVSGRMANSLPEGIRTNARYYLDTESELNCVGPGFNGVADKIVYQGVELIVYGLSPYKSVSPIPHNHYVLIEQQSEESLT